MLFILFCLPLVASLYMDELECAQFHIPLIGPPIPNSPLFHETSQGSLIYQLSENGIIGAIRPVDGEIIWRQNVFGAHYFGLIEISVLMKHGIRVFNAVTGQFIRDDEIYGDKMVVCNNQLVLLDSHSSVRVGNLTWSACHGNYLSLLSLQGEEITLLDLRTMEQVEVPQFLKDIVSQVYKLEYSNDQFLSFTADGESQKNETYIHHSGSTFVLHQKTPASSSAKVYTFNKEVISNLVTLPASDLIVYTVSTVGDLDYVIGIQASRNCTLVTIFSSSGSLVSEYEIPKVLSPKRIRAHLSLRPDNSLIPRLLITTTDAQVHFVKESNHLWSHLDYLSTIQKATFVTLPTVSPALLEETFIQRLTRHLKINHIPKSFFVTKTEKEKDLYGRKYIITATSLGILTAFDTLGTVVWESKFSGRQVRDLWVEGTEAFLVTEWGVNVFDAVLGTQLRREKVVGRVVKIIGGYMLLANDKVSLSPNNLKIPPTYITKRENDDLKGYFVSPSTLQLTKLWDISFPSQIYAVATPPSHKIASIGRVNPDRSVHYKYLNPHLLLVASGSDSELMITYIDSVSGTILRQISHSQVDLSKPVCITSFENVVVYAFFSTSQARGWTVTVSESFESVYPDTRNQGIYIEQKSFLLPFQIKKLEVTQTRLGITHKEVIAITDDNSVVLFPRLVLDSRRADKKVEGILPYDPVVPDDRKWMVSHSLELVNATEIVTEPTMLESTGLVFIFGSGDIFFTRTTPSGSFDVLSKSFNKGMLLSTIFGLVAAIGMTKGMAKKRKEDLVWGI